MSRQGRDNDRSVPTQGRGVESLPATDQHASLFARRLRQKDRAEVMTALGLGPLDGLRYSIRRSAFARAVFVDGEPLAMTGAVLLWDGRAQPWCLTTDAVERHPKAFLRASRYVMAQLGEAFPAGLVQCVDARYTAALRWLVRIGWTLEKQTHECGVFSGPFVRATYTRGG